jgi:uridylate kinase
MLATAMNCLAFADVLRQSGGEAKVLTAVDIQGVGERYSTDKAIEYLKSGKVVMFGCGTGCPFFSTDTAAVLRAAEIGADAILLAKNIDGVYSADPKVDPSAVKYDSISYDDVLAQHLAVMDSTATSLAMDNNIPVIVFALAEPENIVRVLQGEKLGTTVTK